ncbi:PAS domain-containing protein, partial [Candidatus Poribacteria bacterium]|nr:PAS domain-containing protein [Candidatus Poribacteria bacterium]
LEADRLDNHLDRPEVRAALKEGSASSLRHSFSAGQESLYAALRVGSAGDRAVLRLAIPGSAIESQLAPLHRKLWFATGLTAILGGAVLLALSWRFGQPFGELQAGAERFGRGELDRKIPVPAAPGLASLAGALNAMAAQVASRLDELTRERNEREAVLESLEEGVLAFDRNEAVLGLNRMAERMLGIRARDVRGRFVQEAVRNADLQRVVASALEGSERAAEDELLHMPNGVILRARTAPLRGSDGAGTGVLVVLSDVTTVTRLENIRRDFAANVSHELRTPVTSIKGYAETLLDGALDDPAQARRFVEVIARQSSLLEGVIEDLLRLSRLERVGEIAREECALAELLRGAAELAEAHATVRRIEVVCDAGLRVRVNRVLLGQAVGNLLDNALKYSEPGSPVRVEAQQMDGGVVIQVTDQGPGIAPEHLPRLFERFYRVDRARSRELGGTGLGLSIVKHVALAHGGTAEVQSTPGRGSVFSIRLPADS